MDLVNNNFHVILQLEIQLYDGGSPALISDNRALITVNVIRNLNAPVFVDAPYKKTIQKDIGFGTSVATVRADDPDAEVPTATPHSYSWKTLFLHYMYHIFDPSELQHCEI